MRKIKTTANRTGWVAVLFGATSRPAILRRDARDHDNDGLSFQWKRCGTVFKTKGEATDKAEAYCASQDSKSVKRGTPTFEFVVLPVGESQTISVK